MKEEGLKVKGDEINRDRDRDLDLDRDRLSMKKEGLSQSSPRSLRAPGYAGTLVNGGGTFLPATPEGGSPFTPTALDSKAQCRVAHAGLPIIPKNEPQRGSTNIRGKLQPLDLPTN